jgi:hypothetical protein
MSIYVYEVPEDPIPPGPMLSTYEAERLPCGARIVLCLDRVKYPGTFHGMEWAIGDEDDPRRRAYVVLDEPINGQCWALVPAWWLRSEETESSIIGGERSRHVTGSWRPA